MANVATTVLQIDRRSDALIILSHTLPQALFVEPSASREDLASQWSNKMRANDYKTLKDE